MFVSKYKMRIWITIVLFVAMSTLTVSGECPPGQYNPGPDCSFELICPLPSAHTYRRHYCDCWCGPGTIRDSTTHTCVKECPILNPYPHLSAAERLNE